MRTLWRVAFAVLLAGMYSQIGALERRLPTTTPIAPPVPPVEPSVDAATTEIGQTEQIFAYNVVADVKSRSIDGLRFIDTLIFALFAAQAALFAIFIDKTERFGILVGPTEVAFTLAVLAFLPTLASREGPNPAAFRDDFPAAPASSRSELIDEAVENARWNETLRIIKLILFMSALIATGLGVYEAAHAGSASKAAAILSPRLSLAVMVESAEETS
jgi:hypothetical protein